MRRLLLVLLLPIAPFLAHAELVNDFECTLNKGYDVQKLYAFQQEWMTAAHQQGFDERYRTRIWFPLYAGRTETDPLFFVWRGQFADGAMLGRMLDWFPTSPWAERFAQVMNCGKASLWIAPQ